MIQKSIATPFSLGKNERLKSRKLIGQLFKEGKSISSYPFRALYLSSSTESVLQAGFSVSSKNFKRAVDRNRIKRLLREAYRLQKQELQNVLQTRNQNFAVFIIYTGRELPEYEFISKKMTALLKVIVKNLTEGGESK